MVPLETFHSDISIYPISKDVKTLVKLVILETSIQFKLMYPASIKDLTIYRNSSFVVGLYILLFKISSNS